MIQKQLQNKFKEKCGREIEVMLKLHLILPNAEKKKPSSREVATDNYQECFSLMKESALFEFGALNIGHDLIADEELIQQDLGKSCLFQRFWSLTTNVLFVIISQTLVTSVNYCRI